MTMVPTVVMTVVVTVVVTVGCISPVVTIAAVAVCLAASVIPTVISALATDFMVPATCVVSASATLAVCGRIRGGNRGEERNAQEQTSCLMDSLHGIHLTERALFAGSSASAPEPASSD